MSQQKPTRILMIGYPYFLKRLQELGNNSPYTFVNFPKQWLGKWLALFKSDLIYIIGGDLRPNRFFRIALLLGKKIILHWVGSDILEMQAWRNSGAKLCPLLSNYAYHWAEVDWTAQELMAMDIKAQLVPLTPAYFPKEVKELPKKLVALTYLPSNKAAFYGEEKVIRLAEAFPDIVFLAAAASPTERKEDWPANLIPIGWVNNMTELYGEVLVLIRLTEHDGLSFMVLEALAHGRQVIWSYPFTGVNEAGNYEQAAAVLNRLREDFNAGKLSLNETGRDFVSRFYSPEVVWEQIRSGIERALVK